MPSYFRPGVYIEESLRPLSDVSSDPAEAAAAFVGKAKGGPVGPVYVSSWTQFQALYGAISYDTSDLAYALYSYFSNGGRGAYVVRAVASDATSSSLMLFDGTGTTTADEVMNLTATSPGTWASDAASASRVFVTVRPSSTGSSRFDVIIDVGNSNYLAASEQFVDLSMDPADPRYAVDIINSPVVGSRYVSATRSTNIAANNPAPGTSTKTPMTGGTEGVAAIDIPAAAARLDVVNRNLVVNAPGATVADVNALITWAESNARHFLVVDVPKPGANESASASVTAMTTFVSGITTKSSQAAVYGPWLYTTDPGSSAGALRLTAPGGAVVGQIIRTDASRGAHKAPAGVQTNLVGVVQPYQVYTNAQQDTLAQAHVNLIKTVPGSGNCIWGARTLAVGTPDRYISVRRMLIGLKTTLNEITRFAVFEGNDEDLRATVESVVFSYLMSQFDLGAFKGDSPDEAFYVRCDDTNNTAATTDAGIINVEVGVALKSPAEFIVIRLGQQQAGASATDSLEEA